MSYELDSRISGEIKRFCEERQIEQKHLAKALHFSASGMSLLLNGKRKLTVGEYIMICDVLGVGYMQFLPKRVVKEGDL